MTRIDMLRKVTRTGTIGYEIGVCEGEFSEQILELPIDTLVLVDAWEHFPDGYGNDPANVDQAGQDARFRRVVLRMAGDDRVVILRERSRSSDVRRTLGVFPPCWILIDANHTYQECLNDLIFYSGFTKRLFVHDYVDNEASKAMGFGVVQAVDVFLQFNPDWKRSAISDEEWPTLELVKG
jgi:hypothetical protein